ncbi:MAG: mandelate racemase/muconate lactonizing enzyme family protein [Acetobacteraceae bacterium]
MRIRKIDIVEVVVPARSGMINSEGRGTGLHKLIHGSKQAWTLQFDEISKHILVAECDDGTVGVGESLRACDIDVLTSMAESLVGHDVRSIRWQDLPLARTREYEGLEILVLDLIGKCSNMPVSQLLGGAYRDAVRVSAWSGHRTPADAAQLALDAMREGMGCIKFKCELGDDIAGIAAAIREACSENMQIIFDPNERLDEFRHALSTARALEQVGNVLCLEDPLPRWDLDAYRRLRDATTIPIAVHVALGYAQHGQKIEDVPLSFRGDASDMFNLSGGVVDFVRMAHIADAVHQPYWHGSEVDLGIMESAMVHAAAATRGCTIPSDIFGRRIREHDLLAEPLVIDQGAVRVPDGPGLGVQIDHAALNRYAISTTTVGG